MNWLSASAIGALLDMTPRQVRERIALRPDFPRPLRIVAAVIGGTVLWAVLLLISWAAWRWMVRG